MSNRPTVWMLAATLSLAARVGAQEHVMPGMAPAIDQAPCAQGARESLPVIERARTRIETARQTNSPSELRAAIDDLQAVLSQVRAQLTPCAQPAPRAARPSSEQALPMPMDHSKMTMPMDHSRMAMPSAAPPPGTATPPAVAPRQGSGQAPGMPMDHSKMAMPPAAPKAGPTKPTASAPMPVDHSKMAVPPAAPKPGATKPSASTSMPMDHSKMAMPPAAPKPGTQKPDAAKPGAAKLPVMPLERVLDPRCAKTIDLKTAPKATFEGKVYYFCSTAERDRFRRDPAAYLKK